MSEDWCGFTSCPGLVQVAELADSAAYSRDDREELETSWGAPTLEQTLRALEVCRHLGCASHRDHRSAINVLEETLFEAACQAEAAP